MANWMTVTEQIEYLLEQEYWVIDLLPAQVPPQSAGQFFAVEQWWYKGKQGDALRRSFADILLRLNCYFDFLVMLDEDDEGAVNPSPETLETWVRKGNHSLSIILAGEDTLIQVMPESTCMTIFQPSNALLGTLKQLAGAVGLFLWQPNQV